MTKAFQAMPEATSPTPCSQYDLEKGYLHLEEPIYEQAFMAGIAHDLAYELLGLETPDSEEIVLRLSKRQRGQLFYAIDRVFTMAKELEALYYRQNGDVP